MGRETGHSSYCNRYIWHGCIRCGKERWVIVLRSQPKALICRKCHDLRRKRESHPNWKGGKTITSGYVAVRLHPDDYPFSPMAQKSGYVMEHRLVMARHIGRPLMESEIIHHKDGNKQNNAINNLKLTFRGSHYLETRQSHKASYERGFRDGQKLKNDELVKEIRLLRWQISELVGQHKLC